MKAVPWHSLYKHSLYVTKFIRTFFIPSNLLISSQGQNFVTPAANFCDHLPSLFKRYQKFKNTIFSRYFSLLMLLYAKNELVGVFLKICSWSLFVTKLKLKTSKNLPKNINKEESYRTANNMKYSSKILKRRIVSKKLDFFSF